MEHAADVAVIGAGPAGLAAAIELGRRGLSACVFDRGGLTETIFRFPRGMRFFTTRERIEIGGHPLAIPAAKPNREEALAYYRGVARAERLVLRLHEEVTALEGTDGAFVLSSRQRRGPAGATRCRKAILATGTFHRPNRLGVPGEELPWVAHTYEEGHRAFGCDAVVVGGANSAAEAALDLWRSGARVTLVHRGPELSPTLKYWIAPDLRNRIAEGSIAAHLGSRVEEIGPGSVRIRDASGHLRELPADQVFVLTGFLPDPTLYDRLGLAYDADRLVPVHDEATFESARRGVFVIGSLVAGRRSGSVFIENGRHHGAVVAGLLAEALGHGTADAS